MKQWLIAGCLALVGVTVPAEGPASLDPATGAGLARIENLRKTGVVRMSFTQFERATNFSYAYDLAWQKPDRIALQRMGSTLVADDTNLTVQAEFRELIRYATTPQTNHALLTQHLKADMDPVLADMAALLEPDPPNTLLDFLRKHKAVPSGEESLDGQACRVFELELMRHSDFVIRGRMWVDKQWGLIRKMTSRWETPPGATPSRKMPDMAMEFTLTNLVVNQPLPPESFVFTPHEKARRMASPDRLFLSGQSEPNLEFLGQPAPDFTLPLLDGTTFRLSDHTGKVVVIDFWATWCGPCVRALPEMKKLSMAFAGQDVVLVGVSSDQARAEPKVREVVASNGLTYAIGIATNDIGDTYGVTGIPCLFVVDRAGRIQHQHVGYNPNLADQLGLVVTKLLAGQTPETPRPWTEEEKAALAEEVAAFNAMRRPRERIKPDTNAFDTVWQSASNDLPYASPNRPLVVAIAPARHTLLKGSELLVVDAGTGTVQHRLELPPDLTATNLMGHPPPHVFLATPEGGVAVFLHLQYLYRDDGEHTYYQSTGAVLRAISSDGARRWSREISSDVRSMDVLPGPDGQERLLLSGWNHMAVLDADGQERWRQNLNQLQISHIEAGPEPGAWDILLGGPEPGRYRWREPSPAPAEPEAGP